MAEVLRRSDLFSPCPRSLPFPCKGKCPYCVGFPRTSFLPLEQLRSSSLSSDFHGRRLVVVEDRRSKPTFHALLPQMSLCIGKALKWWGKGIQPNMKEIRSAQDLVDSLLNAGNKLTVVDFFSPGCGGCKALHPKICQFAEMNPDVDFLQINYEEHKSMCYSLNVHVLPFFRFYRGAHGRLCSFSCTNATIKKFKDALAKHTPDRCSLGPAKGLEESELVALAANKDLSFNYTRKLAPSEIAEPAPAVPVLPLPSPLRAILDNEEKAIAAAGR